MIWPYALWAAQVEFYLSRMPEEIRPQVLELTFGPRLQDLSAAIRDAIAAQHDAELGRYQAYLAAAAGALVAAIASLAQYFSSNDATWLWEVAGTGLLSAFCGWSAEDSWALARQLRGGAIDGQHLGVMFS